MHTVPGPTPAIIASPFEAMVNIEVVSRKYFGNLINTDQTSRACGDLSRGS
jgi:hypothetical protein